MDVLLTQKVVQHIVEYRVTRFGTKFIHILDELEKRQSEIESEI